VLHRHRSTSQFGLPGRMQPGFTSFRRFKPLDFTEDLPPLDKLFFKCARQLDRMVGKSYGLRSYFHLKRRICVGERPGIHTCAAITRVEAVTLLPWRDSTAGSLASGVGITRYFYWRRGKRIFGILLHKPAVQERRNLVTAFEELPVGFVDLICKNVVLHADGIEEQFVPVMDVLDFGKNGIVAGRQPGHPAIFEVGPIQIGCEVCGKLQWGSLADVLNIGGVVPVLPEREKIVGNSVELGLEREGRNIFPECTVILGIYHLQILLVEPDAAACIDGRYLYSQRFAIGLQNGAGNREIRTCRREGIEMHHSPLPGFSQRLAKEPACITTLCGAQVLQTILRLLLVHDGFVKRRKNRDADIQKQRFGRRGDPNPNQFSRWLNDLQSASA
jgi:hypothetical protein